MLDFNDFKRHLTEAGLDKHQACFDKFIAHGMSTQRHGDLPRWIEALNKLPNIAAKHKELKQSVTLGETSELSKEQHEALNNSLRSLIPWRKGPYSLFGLDIDTEWRSDWKWDRVLPFLSPLKGRNILDVGCGSGYHCWRMHGEQANWVLGIDPSPRFVIQFEMVKQFNPKAKVDVIPLGIEHLPTDLNYFDTTFSMGVLYHRASPIDHLKELRATLRPGGELVLETLVIEGKLGESLMPDDRYAKMRNVWFIPTVDTLIQWLTRCGFENARCVDLNQTTTKEQRTSEWMPNHSLADFLDPNDSNLTAEGYPAPLRAVIIANRPAPKS